MSFALSLLAVRASVVLLLAAAAVAALRRASASARHAALLLAVAALLVLPLLSAVLPRWEMPVLSAPRRHAVPVAAATAPASVPAGRFADRSPRTRPPAAVSSASELEAASPAAAEERGPAPVRAPQPIRPAWPFTTWLLVAWAAGVAAGLVQLLAAAVLVRRTARGASPVSDADWHQPLADAAAHLGLTRPVRLRSSAAAVVPVVYGYPDAVVLLPPGASAWPEDRRRALLVHELAHVGRRDFLSQTLAHVARVLYWPHPLVWWLVRRLRAEAERACDDIVLSAGTTASDYASMLLDAARDLRRARRPLAMLAVVERSRLEERLLALLEPAARRGRVGRHGLLLGASAGLALAVAAATLQPVARVVADSTKPAPAASSALPRPTVTPPRATATSPPAALVLVPATPPAPEPAGSGASSTASETGTLPAAEPAAAPDDGPPPRESAPVVEPVADAPVTVPVPPPPVPAATASPLPSSVPVIRISTELVQLDAVVTDKAGRPVVDLRPEEFEVFESGRRQKVSHLVYVKTGKGPTTGGTAALAAVPQTAEPRTMVMVVDDYGLSLESSVRTREMLTRFVERDLADTDRAAIVRTSEVGTRPLSLTSERTALAADAARIRYSNWARKGFVSRDPGGFPVWDPSRSDWVWRNRIDVDSVWRDSLFAIDSLRAVKSTVDALRAVPGRKAVIFLSEGFPTVVSQDSSGLVHQFTMRPVDGLYDDTGVRAAMQSLIDLANRASVVIYTLDPSGLTTDQVTAEDGSAASGSSLPGYDSATNAPFPAPAIARQRRLERNAREDSLLELAEETGGLAAVSGNDLTAQLGRILADHAGYYLIGYEPASETFAKVSGMVPFHKVKIEVKRRGLKVRSRRGFYGVPDEVLAQAAPPP